MLTIQVKFITPQLAPGLKNGEYCVADGSTVRELLAVCETQCNATVPPENVKFLYTLFEGKPVELDSTLHKNGTLHFCSVIIGG